MDLHETLAADPRLAPLFEEFLICDLYLEQLEHESKPETSTLRSAVRTRRKSILRKLLGTAAAAYQQVDPDILTRAAALILQRQPVGREYYLAKLPD